MKALTREAQAKISPAVALTLLQEGNERFVKNKKAERDLLEQVRDTATGQYPFATILSCIDSRVSAELIFDQGVGDIFSVRVAGNIVNEDLLGSMEFACKLAGTRVVLVLGHTSCGAVKGACDDARLGNLTTLISKIKPAVQAVTQPEEPADRTSQNLQFVDEVAETNVRLTMDNIRRLSPVLKVMEEDGEIIIAGAMYDISSGEVRFL
jgi:carbonic anhydrase